MSATDSRTGREEMPDERSATRGASKQEDQMNAETRSTPPNTPVEFAKFITADTEKWTKVVQFAHLKPE